jgi:hypothetical protein
VHQCINILLAFTSMSSIEEKAGGEQLGGWQQLLPPQEVSLLRLLGLHIPTIKSRNPIQNQTLHVTEDFHVQKQQDFQ